MRIEEVLKERILVLDGAMGTMIQTYGLEEKDFRKGFFENHKKDLKGLNDLLCLTSPYVIESIHKSFLDAGADIIETNTFNATSISMADYGMESHVKDVNLAAANLARKVVSDYVKNNNGMQKYVAGSIGPTSKSASLSSDANNPAFRAVTFDELVISYKEQIEALIIGGVDLLLIETVFDSLNCKAAIFAAREIFEILNKELPIIISGTVTESGRLLSGQTPEAFLNTISHGLPIAIGMNCSLGGDKIYPFLKDMSEILPVYSICYPNAGLPNEFGKYDETPEKMAKTIQKFATDGLVNIVGGCCGTTPLHINEIAKAVKDIKPRIIPKTERMMRLSGLEPLNVSSLIQFVNIGERANVMGSKKFADLIISKKYDEALDIVRAQVDRGAQIIDINMDEAMLDSKEAMIHFIHLMVSDPDIAKVPFMIDSSKWDVIEAGLKCLPGKGIVNSISLKEGEDKFIKDAQIVRKLGAAVIVMAFDEKGQADTKSRKVEIAKRAYKILTEKVSFPPEDIIFDLNVFAVGTGLKEHNNYAVDFIEAVKDVKKSLPYAHVSGGLSNLSFSFRGNNVVREAMHSTFLYHAIPAGMDFGIVNPGQVPVFDEIPLELKNLVEDVVLNKNDDATEKLIDYASNLKTDGMKAVSSEEWRALTPEEKLEHALIKGITKHLEEDLQELLAKNSNPVKIIEGPLMNGMGRVGELFGAGKMFLPQVIKTARVMKKAVEYLTPLIEKDKKEGMKKAGRVLLATVKGDVHDIGKNIVEVVLKCNNYEVINLGEMVPKEKILETAILEKVDMVGLSGLITPSLEEMVSIASEMEKQGFKIPLLIGGATTSKIHTAVKISPKYKSGFTLYVKDASQVPKFVSSLLNPSEKEKLIVETHQNYDSLIDIHTRKQNERNLLSIEDARKNGLKIDWNNTLIKAPSFLGIRQIEDISLQTIVDNVDWSEFINEWGIKGTYPDVLNDDSKKEEVTNLLNDAKNMLKKLVSENWIQPEGVVGFFKANSVVDDIEVYCNDGNSTLAVINTLRQQSAHKNNSPNIALSDYFVPKSCNKNDYIGFFVLSAGKNSQNIINKMEKDGEEYDKFLFKFLLNRLAEAYSAIMHEKVAKDIMSSNHMGIRPAFGYPICPDHSEKKKVFDILQVEKYTDIKLSETFMMIPEASVCGIYIFNPYSNYFGLGKIGKDQVVDYAARRNITIKEAEKWLSSELAYSV